MVMMRTFRPLRYNPALLPQLEKVVAPPYDVISPAKRAELYDRHPDNVIRLILNREADPYADAAKHFQEWRDEKILVQESQASLAYYVENFRLPDGSEHERSGILAAVRLEPFSTGRIRPHERTFARAKEDRLKLMRACRANLSPIFGLYAQRPDALEFPKVVAGRKPADMDLVDDAGERHRVWLLPEGKVTSNVLAALADAEIIIADGHHRYETALAYRDLRHAEGDTDPEAPHNFILMYLTSMHDPGLVILPTHRVIKEVEKFDVKRAEAVLREHFNLQEYPIAAQADFRAALQAAPNHGSFGVALQGKDTMWIATLRDEQLAQRYAPDVAPEVRRLDVAVLDSVLLSGLLELDCVAAGQAGKLIYTHDEGEAFGALSSGAEAVFFMQPPHVEDLVSVCGAGQTMPQKSTYFFPKLLTGLVFHVLD